MKSANGFRPGGRLSLHYGSRKKKFAAAALLGLAIAGPALAADLSHGYPNPPVERGRPVADSETPIYVPAALVPSSTPRRSLPPPDDVLAHVMALRLACPEWQIGPTPTYQTEAHICSLLEGREASFELGVMMASVAALILAGVGVAGWKLSDWLSEAVGWWHQGREAP